MPRWTFRVIRTDFARRTEDVLHLAASRQEADRLVMDLSAANREPSVLFYWTIAMRAGTMCHSAASGARVDGADG